MAFSDLYDLKVALKAEKLDFLFTKPFTLLLSISKTNSLISHVEFSVVFANKNVSKNPPRSHGKFQTHKTGNALSLTKLAHLEKYFFSTLALYYSIFFSAAGL